MGHVLSRAFSGQNDPLFRHGSFRRLNGCLATGLIDGATEADSDARALAWAGLDAHLTAMQTGQTMHNGEAQPCPRPSGRIGTLSERLRR